MTRVSSLVAQSGIVYCANRLSPDKSFGLKFQLILDMINDTDFFLSNDMLTCRIIYNLMDLVGIVSLVNLLTNVTATFVPVVKQWRAIQKVN